MHEQMQLQGQINLHQQKSKNTYHKIENTIDRIIELYQLAQNALRQGKDQNLIIEELNQELLNIKPIKTIREHQIHYYRKLSNLLKKIQSNANKHNFSQSRFSRKLKSEINHQNESKITENKLNQFLEQFMNKTEELDALDEIIVQNFLRNGKWACADVWPQIRKRIDPCNLFEECLRLKRSISRGQFQQAIKWCQNEKLYETHEISLEYELHKLNIALILQKQTVDQALDYYALNFPKFHNDHLQQIELLIGFILYKGKWTAILSENQQVSKYFTQRFSDFVFTEDKCVQLSNIFEEEYFKHNSINRFNILKILYDCSQKISDDYYKLMKVMWDGQSKTAQRKEQSILLPFSVKLDKEYHYHSLFLCPVTKEVQSGNEKSMLLSCGHLISSAAHSRIVQENRNRRKVKCPICQKEINHEQSLNIQF